MVNERAPPQGATVAASGQQSADLTLIRANIITATTDWQSTTKLMKVALDNPIGYEAVPAVCKIDFFDAFHGFDLEQSDFWQGSQDRQNALKEIQSIAFPSRLTARHLAYIKACAKKEQWRFQHSQIEPRNPHTFLQDVMAKDDQAHGFGGQGDWKVRTIFTPPTRGPNRNEPDREEEEKSDEMEQQLLGQMQASMAGRSSPVRPSPLPPSARRPGVPPAPAEATLVTGQMQGEETGQVEMGALGDPAVATPDSHLPGPVDLAGNPISVRALLMQSLKVEQERVDLEMKAKEMEKRSPKPSESKGKPAPKPIPPSAEAPSVEAPREKPHGEPPPKETPQASPEALSEEPKDEQKPVEE